MNRKPWTMEEEAAFLELFQKYGNDWKQYQITFPERSIASIKSKFHNETLKQGSTFLKTIEYKKQAKGGLNIPGRSTICKIIDDLQLGVIQNQNDFEFFVAAFIGNQKVI
ncbi:Conserved_hypothetical protein [Hexamita inflata]|uniref:Uncharacterized protein n=1 Tax=Hexamita inflata TaxID=28002 RepID=A0AA86REU8_9EUKA|nr:Conserved hypothetical protein [Hexamita inflata]